jgi:hypothetical protein
MPTGYTAAIKDGITFATFAMSCARAFGACITLRDEPADTPIPDEFQPSDYHSNALQQAQAKLAELQAFTPEQWAISAKKEYDDIIANKADGYRDALRLNRNYLNMRRDVENWQPPSPDHTKLKEFMLEQIETSMRVDCDLSYYSREVDEMTGEQWKAESIRRVEGNIRYHTEGMAKELEVTAQRNLWVRRLRESLQAEHGRA